MEMEKKKLVIIILALILVTSGVGNVLLTILAIHELPEVPSGEVLRIAWVNPFPWMYQPQVTIDPCNSLDDFSNELLDQVVETLIVYDLTNPSLPLVGRLAESWYWPDNTTIEFKLRENVYFHDGSRFKAECVLHTIARINFFGNWSGTLDPDIYPMAFPHSLYKFSDGIPIFNDTLSYATDDYNVTLVLNRPYAPVEGLLGYTASAIVHPDSTPADEMLELNKDLVIGTGPFKLVRYVPNSEILFSRWERYWRTGAYWDHIVYVYYGDVIRATYAMHDGDIDWLFSIINSPYKRFYMDLGSYPMITGDGVHDYINSSVYSYITFNSEIFNKTWRKAISYAFNYTFFIEYIMHNHLEVKANSLVPPGFPAHNKSVKGAHFDTEYARQLMQRMGYGYDGPGYKQNPWDTTPDGADEDKWTAAEFVPTTQTSGWTLPTGNFTDNTFNFRHTGYGGFYADLIEQLGRNLDLIGCKVQPLTLTWDQFIELGEKHPDRLHIYYLGWGTDYFETFNMINPLVNNESDSNLSRINDPHIQNLLEQTIAETNTAARYILYKRLQGYIIDVQFYHIPLCYYKLRFIHAPSLKGFPYNCMENVYWYPTYRE